MAGTVACGVEYFEEATIFCRSGIYTCATHKQHCLGAILLFAPNSNMLPSETRTTQMIFFELCTDLNYKKNIRKQQNMFVFFAIFILQNWHEYKSPFLSDVRIFTAAMQQNIAHRPIAIDRWSAGPMSHWFAVNGILNIKIVDLE